MLATDRSAIMRAVKSRDTKPEMIVRSLARSISPGYRLNRKDIPGKPDLAWIGRKQAVFVHGCFWHGHDCPRGARIPRTNRDYWLAKIERNRMRDRSHLMKLEALGWRCLVIWECELRDQPEAAARLSAFLTETPSRRSS